MPYDALSQPRTPPTPSAGEGSVVTKKLAPGAAGIKRLEARFGPALVCVRYRLDPANRRRLTTVELIVDQRPLPADPYVRIAYGETDLRRRVKLAGGAWDAERKLWQVPRETIRRLKLEKRIVGENG